MLRALNSSEGLESTMSVADQSIDTSKSKRRTCDQTSLYKQNLLFLVDTYFFLGKRAIQILALAASRERGGMLDTSALSVNPLSTSMEPILYYTSIYVETLGPHTSECTRSKGAARILLTRDGKEDQ